MRSTSCFARDLGEPRDEGGGIGNGGQIDDESVEIVVIVPLLGIVMRGPLRKIVLGGGLEPEQHIGIDPPLMRLDDLHRARDGFARCPRARARASGASRRSVLLSTIMSAQSN